MSATASQVDQVGWIDRETRLPVAIGLLIALVVHVAFVPPLTRMMLDKQAAVVAADVARQEDEVADRPPPEQAAQPEQEEVRLGKDDAPERLTMSWISHDDFRKLVAKDSTVEQPAVQRDVDPAERAPVVLDPTPPVPSSPQVQASTPAPTLVAEAEAQATVPQPVAEAPAPAPQPQVVDEAVAEARVEAEATVEPAPTPPVEQLASETLREEPGEPVKQVEVLPPAPSNTTQAESGVQTTEAVTTDVTKPALKAEAEAQATGPSTKQMAATTPEPRKDAEPTKQQEAEAQATAAPAQPSSAPAASSTPSQQVASNPTTAAKSDKEADPTSKNDEQLEGKLGGVLVGRGYQIQTVRPRFSVITQLSAIPRNPEVRIVFDADGSVTEAEIVKSSGYAGVDAPLLAAMYKWRATGKLFEERKQPLELRIPIKFD